jgi:plastocyanin
MLAVALGLSVVCTVPAGIGPARAAVGALKGTPVGEVPLPEPGFLEPVPAGECTPENAYETAQWGATGGGTIAALPEGAECERLRFAYGPLTVRPGQNDALLSPVSIEKPAYDGYVLRFKPDLVRADGTPPLVDEIHLHHSVWLKGDEAIDPGLEFPPSSYNDELIPFFASGEEKTTALFPAGHGYPVNATDSWLLLYMVHNYTTSNDVVWLTYELDYVRKADGDAAGITPIHPVWIDVQRRPVAPGAPSTPANPVFNVQKGFGHLEGEGAAARRLCTWPRENCARFDAYGNVTPQQGQALPSGSLPGADEPVDGELRGTGDGGTLVWIAGHLHPGGVRNDVELVRGGVAKPIFTSEGVPWSRDVVQDPTGLGAAGGPLDSWDFSMTTTGLHQGWAVNIQPGDRLRINATYDAEISWYENMGIVVGFVALDGGSGKDVFGGVTPVAGVPDGAPRPVGWDPPLCTPSATVLCTHGIPTHAHLPESSRYGGGSADPLPTGDGPLVDTIPVADFEYGLADQGVVFGTGQVPQVKVGATVQFVNADTAGDIWHTITRCAPPCSGGSGLAYPKADGGDPLPWNEDDFDSSEIGFGLFWSPAKTHVDDELRDLGEPPWSFGDIPAFAGEMDDGVLWEFTPDASDVGETVTFFCRIHIAMRGAVKVVA